MPAVYRHPLCIFAQTAVLGLAAVCLGSGAGKASAAEARGKEFYEKQVLPVLQEFCYDCHGDGMDKGEFALDKHKEYSAMFADRKLWDTIREHVNTHVMPPEGKAQPTNAQRDLIVNYVDDEVMWVDESRPDPGHVTLRRLNRVEYNNTVRDVFGIDNRPANVFPPDDTGYGYDNIGDVLSLSPMLMEKYLRVARKVAEDAVWVKPASRYKRDKEGDAFTVTKGDAPLLDGVRVLSSPANIAAGFQVPSSGVYRASLTVTADQAGPDKARVAIFVNGKEVRQMDVSGDMSNPKEWERWETLSFDLPIASGGNQKVSVAFLNDFYDSAVPDPKKRDRNLYIKSLNLDGPIQFRRPDHSKFLTWLLPGKNLEPDSVTLAGLDFDKGPGYNIIEPDLIFVATTGFVHRQIDLPADGEYRFILNASASQAGKEKAKVRLVMDGQNLGEQFIDTADVSQTADIPFKGTFKAGPRELQVHFLNDFSENGADRNLNIHSVTIERLGSDVTVPTKAELPGWIDRLSLRLCRRPVGDAETKKLTALADMVLEDGGSPLDALKVVSEALLCSSKFLFRGGAEPVGEVVNGTVLVDEFTLASRLSYFLWSTCPDEELLVLAGKGELRKNLKPQITRMIKDWRGWAMAENFAGQWLRLRDVELVSPNRKTFPDFDISYATLMKKESQLFFDHIYRGNRSALEILDSDYTFLNEKLAEYYKIPGVKGKDFVQVSLKGTPRGGILTQGSILTITSHPNRTSPVNRGKFLLENILGTPPPPAPQNVPPFKEGAGKAEGTLRQRFEAHRSNPACASCHAFLDPMGFAYENYDGIGRYRQKDSGQAIDPTGKLITGETFQDAEQLRKLLVGNKKHDFIRCLVENLLIYSLGRGLDYPDKLYVKQISKIAEESEYRFQDIVVAVAESIPFQKMRASEVKKVAAE